MAQASRPAIASDFLGRTGPNFDLFPSWLAVHGEAAYASYKEEAATPSLTYEDWTASEHVLGPYMYHLALDAWEEANSSDEELEETGKPASPGLLAQHSKEIVKSNGRTRQRTMQSSAPATDADTVEPDASTKKRRRRKKKFLSEDIISSDDIDDSSPSLAGAQAEQPVTPAQIRKPKKKSQLNLTVSPEDIEDSAPVSEASNNVASPVTPDGPSPSSTTRRGLRTRTPAQKRPYFHHDQLFNDQIDDDGQPIKNDQLSAKAGSKLAQVSYPNSDEEILEDDLIETFDEPPVPQPLREKRFKGKGRAWKKGESDEDGDYHQGIAKKPKKRGRPRKSQLSQSEPMNELRGQSAEAGAVDSKSEIVEETSPRRDARPQRRPRKSYLSKEFIGDESSSEAAPDEDDKEIIVMEASTRSEKVKRKPKKTFLSAEFIADDTSSDTEQVEKIDKPEEVELDTSGPTKQRAKRRPKIRKSKLSEEFVRDDTDSDVEMVEGNDEPIVATSAKSTSESKAWLVKGDVIEEYEDEEERSASSKKSTPGSRGKKTESALGLQVNEIQEVKVGAEDQENRSTTDTPLRNSRKNTASLGSVESIQ